LQAIEDFIISKQKALQTIFTLAGLFTD